MLAMQLLNTACSGRTSVAHLKGDHQKGDTLTTGRQNYSTTTTQEGHNHDMLQKLLYSYHTIGTTKKKTLLAINSRYTANAIQFN